ncbi:MAG: DMT family transporter, partial [Bacteroidota bacterium]|nr:DMT family transporter [Bacteroidota bacterium]
MRYYFSILFAAVLWGTMYAATTEWLPGGGPLQLGAIRALPAALVLMFFVRKWPGKKDIGRLFWLSIFNIGIFFGLFFFAAYRLPGGVAATLGAFNPFFVALFAWGLLSQKPKKANWIAIALGIAGIAMLVLAPSAELDGLGVLAVLGATLAIALGNVLTKKWGLPDSTLEATTWQLLIAGILLGVVALAIEGIPPLPGMRELGAYAYISFVATGLAYLAFFYGIRNLKKPQMAAVLTLATPLAAVLIDAIFLNKRLSGLQYIG